MACRVLPWLRGCMPPWRGAGSPFCEGGMFVIVFCVATPACGSDISRCRIQLSWILSLCLSYVISVNWCSGEREKISSQTKIIAALILLLSEDCSTDTQTDMMKLRYAALNLIIQIVLQVIVVQTVLQVIAVQALLQVILVQRVLQVIVVQTELQVIVVQTVPQVIVQTVLEVILVQTVLQVIVVQTVLQVIVVQTVLQVIVVQTLLQVIAGLVNYFSVVL